MLDFNLLPSDQKKELQKERLYLVIIGIFKGIVLALFCVFVILLSMDFSLSYLSSSQEQVLDETKKDETFKKIMKLDVQIENINSSIENVYNVQKDLVYYAPIIEKISNLIPGGVTLTELNIEKKIEGQSDSSGEEGEGAPGNSTETKSEASPTTTPKAGEANEDSLTEEEKKQKEYTEIKIVGMADTRDQVIKLEKDLKEDGSFTNVVSPLKNVLKAKKVEFELTFRPKK